MSEHEHQHGHDSSQHHGQHAEQHQHQDGEGRENSIFIYALVILAGLVMAYNQFAIFGAQNAVAALGTGGLVGASLQSASASAPLQTQSAPATGDAVQDAINAVISRGTPDYGSELGISFEDPVNGMNKLASLENSISLSGDKLQRYTELMLKMSCEYCCGAPSIIDSRGNAACGCAHSGAMRGLGKYLVDKHPEYSDLQILEHVGRWKALFFPKDTVKKAVGFIAATGKRDVTAILYSTVNKKDLAGIGISDPAGGASAGTAGAATDLNSLPGQVGGC